jgi:hypothetical protein
MDTLDSIQCLRSILPVQRPAKMTHYKTQNTRETIFLLGLVLASIVVPLNNFQTQVASAVSDTVDAATSNGNITSDTTTHSMNSGTIPTDAETKLVLALRDLWVDHTDWTRMYIVSFLADLPDTEVVAQRLLRNQEDIGDAIKPFYGEDAGNELTNLLNGHTCSC